MSKWNDIPIGRENAISYDELCNLWGMNKRAVRKELHRLACIDNKDNYILIRSSTGRGFYRTDDEYEITSYRKECLNRGRSIFAQVKKCNRVLKHSDGQIEYINNIKCLRESRKLRQCDLCSMMWSKGVVIDCALLSKIENNVCLPSPSHVAVLAEIFDVSEMEVFDVCFVKQTIKMQNTPLASGEKQL